MSQAVLCCSPSLLAIDCKPDASFFSLGCSDAFPALCDPTGSHPAAGGLAALRVRSRSVMLQIHLHRVRLDGVEPGRTQNRVVQIWKSVTAFSWSRMHRAAEEI